MNVGQASWWALSFQTIGRLGVDAYGLHRPVGGSEMMGQSSSFRSEQKRAGAWTLALLMSAVAPGLCQAAPILFGDHISGAARQISEAAGTNHFDQSSAFVTNNAEFSGIDGDYEIRADFQSTDFVNIFVDRIPISPNETAPIYRFSFSGLDFTPASIVTGLTRIGGTPGIGLSDVAIGAHFAEFTIGTTFLSNGGSFSISVRFDTQPAPAHDVPEPATLALFGLGLAGLGFARRRKAAVRNPGDSGLNRRAAVFPCASAAPIIRGRRMTGTPRPVVPSAAVGVARAAAGAVGSARRLSFPVGWLSARAFRA